MSKHDLIILLGKQSETKYHELIIECLDFYKANGTRELAEEQIINFCKLKGMI